LQRTEGAIIRALQRDPLLAERVRRLQTIPAVGKRNDEFIDLPAVDPKYQRRPSFASDEITKIISKASAQMGLFYATLAGSGVRIGECIGLEVQHIKDNTLFIEQQVWNNSVEDPKIAAGTREIDLDPGLAELIKKHIGDRKSGYIFPNENGGALHQSDVLRRSLHPILKGLGLQKQGFHGFRRFRVTHLRKQRTPENLIRFWVGHSGKSVTDRYDQVQGDIEFRRSAAAAAGLGFDISMLKTGTENGVLYPVSNFVPSEPSATMSVIVTK
jgi:integrase